jgi:hypothetical protein
LRKSSVTSVGDGFYVYAKVPPLREPKRSLGSEREEKSVGSLRSG